MRISSSIPAINANSSPVIHNVLDTGFEGALESSWTATVPESLAGAFVCLGSVNSYRNIVNLIRGYRRYRDAGGTRRLWIAGPPGARRPREQIEHVAASTTGVTIIWRSLSRPECLAALRSASAVVLPSKVEASPVAALEAAAANTNVVLSRIVGHTEILSEYGAVPRECLFDPHSPADIAQALQVAETGTRPISTCHAVLADPNQREDARISWGDRVANWLHVLNESASQNGGGFRPRPVPDKELK